MKRIFIILVFVCSSAEFMFSQSNEKKSSGDNPKIVFTEAPTIIPAQTKNPHENNKIVFSEKPEHKATENKQTEPLLKFSAEPQSIPSTKNKNAESHK